jgi:hypothetical protein
VERTDGFHTSRAVPGATLAFPLRECLLAGSVLLAADTLSPGDRLDPVTPRIAFAEDPIPVNSAKLQIEK